MRLKKIALSDGWTVEVGEGCARFRLRGESIGIARVRGHALCQVPPDLPPGIVAAAAEVLPSLLPGPAAITPALLGAAIRLRNAYGIPVDEYMIKTGQGMKHCPRCGWLPRGMFLSGMCKTCRRGVRKNTA